MNKNMPKSRTSLFLMELIIAILFFSIASAVCMQLFAKAHLTSEKTKELNHAVSIAQSCAEAMRGSDGTIDTVASYFPQAIVNGNQMEIPYDNDFNVSSKDNASYVCNVTIAPNGVVQKMTIEFIKLSDQSEIYKLNATKYVSDFEE